MLSSIGVIQHKQNTIGNISSIHEQVSIGMIPSPHRNLPMDDKKRVKAPMPKNVSLSASFLKKATIK